jgi:hypothetical protein
VPATLLAPVTDDFVAQEASVYKAGTRLANGRKARVTKGELKDSGSSKKIGLLHVTGVRENRTRKEPCDIKNSLSKRRSKTRLFFEKSMLHGGSRGRYGRGTSLGHYLQSSWREWRRWRSSKTVRLGGGQGEGGGRGSPRGRGES